jgi:hypothetical protein
MRFGCGLCNVGTTNVFQRGLHGLRLGVVGVERERRVGATPGISETLGVKRGVCG